MSEYGEKSAVMSTFKDGLVMDMNPMASKNTTLSDALNATFVTMRGNELVLQNDYGNGRIEKAYLPPGYIPIGMKEYGGIIYIASYNPLTNKGLVGSFPSPERNIDSQEWNTDEKKISWENFIDSSYEEKKSCSTFIAKLDIFGDKIIHSGDKYTIYFKDDPDNLEGLKYLSNYFNTTEDTYTKVTSPKNNTLTIKLAVVDSENNLRDITELCRRFDKAGDVIQFDINSSPVLKFNSGYFIQDPTVKINEKEYTSHSNEDFITERNKKAVNTYNNKISGLVYLIVELNVVQAFNVSTKAFKAGENGFSSYAIKYLELKIDPKTVKDEIEEGALYLILFEFNYKYNCPDGYYKDKNDAFKTLDDKLLQENPMLGDYSSYFGNNTASNILGSYLKYSTDDKERIIDFNGAEKWELINWSTEETAYPIYDVNTGLYSKTLYTLVALKQLLDSNTIFNYYCEPAMSYSRIPQLAVLGSINLSLIGGNSINITAWRYYNDVTTNQTHLVVGLQETLPDNCAIINSYYEVFDIDEVNPDNDIEPLFTLLSQRSSYNGEYQEIYALREEDDDTALVWNHLYLMAIIVEVKEDAEDGTSTIHREVLGYRYFLGTLLFNTCFFNNSKVFAKDYMESFWNNASEHIDPNKYIFDSKEFDGETYYSNFKDEYSSIFSIPLELKTRTQKVETKNWFKKLCGAPEWSEEDKSSEELLSVFYENRRAGELTFSNSLEAPNLSLYPINNFGEISNGGYGLEEVPNILLKYADLQKNYMGQYYKNLITEILEVNNEDDLYTSEKYVSENPATYPSANYFYTKQISENANITIKYDLQYISELYGYYLEKTIDFKYLYKPFLNVHKKGFLDPEIFFPKDSQKSLLELTESVKKETRIYSEDLGGTPLIYWPAFNNPSRLNMGDYKYYALLKYFVEHEGVEDGRNLRYKSGPNNYNTGLGKMHVDTYIGPCHNLLKGAKMWDFGSGGAEYDWKDATYRVPVGINVPNDYERITTVENLSSSLVFIPLSDFAWDDPAKKESHSCGGTLVFMDSYAKALNLDNQSLLTWNTVSCNPNSDYGFNKMVIGNNLYKVSTDTSSIYGWGALSLLTLIKGSTKIPNPCRYIDIQSALNMGEEEEFGWKTFSIDNLGFSPGSVQLCFRTSKEGDKWKFSSNNMRKIDLSLIEKLCMDKGLDNKNSNPAVKRRFLNSPDYFLRSSLYLKTLYDYLNSICILASKNEIKEMYTFDPTKILGILDYTHKVNFTGSLKIALNLSNLSEQPAGKALLDFITKLYTNTRTILNSKYKNEEANKSFGRLLSSMWFVFPKTILTTLEESLSFNLKGTEERISNFSQTPKVAILTDDNLETFLYNGRQIEPIGEESVFIKGEDGRIYPPDPNIEEYSDAVNIMYYSSKGILYYKGEIGLDSETEIGGYNDVGTGPCISYAYLKGKYDRYATLKDIRALYAGVSLNENSTYYTPEIISLLNLPYLKTCLINAVEKYYE